MSKVPARKCQLESVVLNLRIYTALFLGIEGFKIHMLLYGVMNTKLLYMVVK